MPNNLWSEGVLNSVRALSDSTLTGICTIFPFAGSPTNIGSTPIMTNRGGVSQTFSSSFANIRCRLDVDTKGLIPEKSKDNIDVSRVERYMYIALSDLISIGYMIKVKDEILTSEGNILGNAVRYRVIDVDTETDELDVVLLLEVAT